MNKQKTKKAMILIYVLFLVTLSIIFSTILLNNNAFLFNISKYFDVDSKLHSNINSDGRIMININKNMNSNGSGFIDNISCPSGFSIIMSGAINTGAIGSTLVNSGSIYCEGTYLANSLKLYFNTGFTDIVEADYNGFIIGITAGIGNTVFGDSDSTLMDFSSYNLSTPDGYDDDFDSDNYMVTSTGDTSTGTYYLDSFQDDDVLGRKELFGYISYDFGFKKAFWNTTRTLKIINENSNNNDTLNIKIGDVDSGILHFDIDKSSEIKLVQFDRDIFHETKELKLMGTYKGILGAGIGYLQENSGDLSLSITKTGNEFSFDFMNNDYAIFLKNTSTGSLLYKILGETDTGTGIYITPIDDSDENIMRYLGNEILIDISGRYISKEEELIYEK
ncbi:MAG: hypothetical protein QM490_02855 [Candidatus Gracilibacteria bacterium]